MLLPPDASAAAAGPDPGRPRVGDIVRVVGGPGKGRTARITVDAHDATPFALGTLYAHWYSAAQLQKIAPYPGARFCGLSPLALM